jgi:D-alanine-D-alanine ligase-like ATP-grasp enzyme
MLRTLYLINSQKTEASEDLSLSLLKKAATAKKIKTKTINVETFDFSQNIKLTKNDGIYRIATRSTAALVEKTLINKDCTTLYSHWHNCIGRMTSPAGSSLIHNKYKLPVIKTVLHLTNDKNLLKKYASHLDGFPLIIKAIGNSHGIGVMKIDSFESLCSVADYLVNTKDRFILRKYIDYATHARLIVLGNKVISSIEYKKVHDDFRSNAGNDLNVLSKNFGKKINKIAIDAVNVLGYEFGGVDILIDKKNTPYIAEVNFPCYFPRAQKATNINIAEKIIDYLIKKSQNSHSNKK